MGLVSIPLPSDRRRGTVPKSPTRRSALSDESPEDDKTTLWVRGSSAFPLVPKEPTFPLVPKDRSSDSKVAVSKTLRPMAPGFRESPLAYVLSTIALGVAGVALYYA